MCLWVQTLLMMIWFYLEMRSVWKHYLCGTSVRPSFVHVWIEWRRSVPSYLQLWTGWIWHLNAGYETVCRMGWNFPRYMEKWIYRHQNTYLYRVGRNLKLDFFFLIHQMFLKIINFLCIYFWLCWVFIVVWCRGFSLPWLFLLKNTGSRQAGFSGGRARFCCSMALEFSCTRDWTCVPCIER